MSKPENPRAFPSAAIADQFGGMTMRDWFAGQALGGMLASEAGIQPYPHEWAAERAYLIADAMLWERGRDDRNYADYVAFERAKGQGK